ncbi:MAG TPA: hypothetical protein VMK12_28185 [Anaeromyxobacteraceae bacterium]|nr:hypothetical protein [Anaeromyxobacteraceae bacterium]
MTLALRFSHILAAALWMGSALFWPGALRRALSLGLPHASAALTQARMGARLDLGAGLATVGTGLLFASPLGGGPVRAGVLLGLGLALARLGLLFGMARPALRGVGEAVAKGDALAATAASRRLPAYAGSAHLLWLLALAAMVFPL